MPEKQTRTTHTTTLISLFLTAAIIALTGIVALIPESQASAENFQEEQADVTVFWGAEEEIIAIGPIKEASTVFSGFSPPLQGRISSCYGYRTDPITGKRSYHRGIDIAVAEGTDVLAAMDGTVKASAYSDVGGHYVIIKHENGTESYYGHLQKRTVAKGDIVRQGERIGLSGNTGVTTGPHLHFQLTYNNRTVDPQKHIAFTS